MSFLAFAKKFVLACSSLDPEVPTDPDMIAALTESLHRFRTADSELEMATGGAGFPGGLFSLDGGDLRVADDRCTCGRRVPARSGFCMCGKLVAGAWSCTCRAPRIYHPSAPACSFCTSPPTGRAPKAEELAANMARVRSVVA